MITAACALGGVVCVPRSMGAPGPSMETLPTPWLLGSGPGCVCFWSLTVVPRRWVAELPLLWAGLGHEVGPCLRVWHSCHSPQGHCS